MTGSLCSGAACSRGAPTRPRSQPPPTYHRRIAVTADRPGSPPTDCRSLPENCGEHPGPPSVGGSSRQDPPTVAGLHLSPPSSLLCHHSAVRCPPCAPTRL